MITMSRIIPNALPIRELPCTFTLHIHRVSRTLEVTITNNYEFEAHMHYPDMSKIDELPHTADKRAYSFVLWSDESYAVIKYNGKQYLLDKQSAEDEVRHG